MPDVQAQHKLGKYVSAASSGMGANKCCHYWTLTGNWRARCGALGGNFSPAFPYFQVRNYTFVKGNFLKIKHLGEIFFYL